MRISVHQRPLQRGMRMAADNEVDFRHGLCQQFVLRTLGFIPYSAVRQADDQFSALCLKLRHLCFRRSDHIVKRHRRQRRTGNGINAHHAKDPRLNPVDIQKQVFLRAVGFHGALEGLPIPGRNRSPVDVGNHHGRQFNAFLCRIVHGRLQHTGHSLATVIKLVIAKRGGVKAQMRHHGQLGSVGFIDGLIERAHGKITGIQHQRVACQRLFAINQRFQSGKAAARSPILHLGRKVGMHVMGKQDAYAFLGRGRQKPQNQRQHHRKQHSIFLLFHFSAPP